MLERLTILAVFLAALTWGAASLVGSDAAATAAAASRNVPIAFVGDSNVVRGAGVTTNVLQGGPLDPANVTLGYIPQFVGRPGMTLNVGYWQGRLATLGAGWRPDVIVLNIGINDTQALDNYDGRIDAFLGLLPAGVRVLWPGYPIMLEPVAKQVGAHAVNHAWAMAALRHPQQLTIVPWGAVARDHPEWIDRTDPVTKQVHYTPDGYQALINLEIPYLKGP